MSSEPLDSFAEVISDDQLAPRQAARGDDGYSCDLRKEPQTLDELEMYPEGTLIQMENDTQVLVSCREDNLDSHEKFLCLEYSFHNPRGNKRLVITGKTNDTIVETGMIWWSLHCPEERNTLLIIRGSDLFDFTVISPQLLFTIFVNNEKRRVHFERLTMTAAQSVVLASIPHPIDLSFDIWFSLDDEGDAFVKALQSRKSHFGSLRLWGSVDKSLSRKNIELLLELTIFDKLKIPWLNSDKALLPFSVPLTTLDYVIDSTQVSIRDVHSLDIVARELILTVYGDRSNRGGIKLIVALLRRMAVLGYFEHLEFVQGYFWTDKRAGLRFLFEFVSTITANKKLKSVKLTHFLEYDESRLEIIFGTFEHHPGMRTVQLSKYPISFDPDYFFLKRLISRNRNIKVFDGNMQLLTDGFEVDNIYCLNSFYSATLKLEDQSIRTWLVRSTLTKSASGSFQHSALLLANYTDSLCELIQCADMESLADSARTNEATSSASDLKRKTRDQPPRAAKRAMKYLEK